MSLSLHIAYAVGETVQYYDTESYANDLYNVIISHTGNQNIYMELLDEEEFNHMPLNDPLRIIRPFDKYDKLNDYREVWIYVQRTDIHIVKPLHDTNFTIKISLTAGSNDDTIQVLFECNDCDNYNTFKNRLCNVMMDNIKYTPFKQYIMRNNNVLRADDILLYLMPNECKIDYITLLADPSLPYDLDYALPRLRWCRNQGVTIEQVTSFIGSFVVLATPGKRIPWLRNSMEILSTLYNIKGYDEISIYRLSAIAADYVNELVVDKMDANFPSMVVPPLQFSNVDSYDLRDENFIKSVDDAVHSIIVKRSLH
jgi:hypothetical protein